MNNCAGKTYKFEEVFTAYRSAVTAYDQNKIKSYSMGVSDVGLKMMLGRANNWTKVDYLRITEKHLESLVAYVNDSYELASSNKMYWKIRATVIYGMLLLLKQYQYGSKLMHRVPYNWSEAFHRVGVDFQIASPVEQEVLDLPETIQRQATIGARAVRVVTAAIKVLEEELIESHQKLRACQANSVSIPQTDDGRLELIKQLVSGMNDNARLAELFQPPTGEEELEEIA